MDNLTGYDGDLRMFRETPRPVEVAHLRFLRWLADQGRLEHPPAGRPSGEHAQASDGAQPLGEAA